jgi:hypothetical protein
LLLINLSPGEDTCLVPACEFHLKFYQNNNGAAIVNNLIAMSCLSCSSWLSTCCNPMSPQPPLQKRDVAATAHRLSKDRLKQQGTTLRSHVEAHSISHSHGISRHAFSEDHYQSPPTWASGNIK